MLGQLPIVPLGAGHASLNYIKRIPLCKIKIDRVFIHDIATNEESINIVKAIIALSKALNLKVVAEGIETEEQRKILQDLVCLEGQGFYFSKPISPEALAPILQGIQPLKNC